MAASLPHAESRDEPLVVASEMTRTSSDPNRRMAPPEFSHRAGAGPKRGQDGHLDPERFSGGLWAAWGFLSRSVP